MVFQHVVTPQRIAATEQEQALLAGAKISEVDYRGERLNVQQWGQSGPRVLLVHGWDSRATHLGGFVEALLAAGYQVLAFDGPGHGESTGNRSNVVDLGRAVLRVTESIGPIEAAIGHSMGSAALLYAFAHGLKVEASVHIAGPSSLIRVLQRAAEMIGMTAEQGQRLIDLMEAETGLAPKQMELKHLAHGFRHPSLIVHDEADREIPFEAAEALHAAWPGSELHAVFGLGHRRIIRDPSVIQHCVAMFTQYLPVNQAATDSVARESGS